MRYILTLLTLSICLLLLFPAPTSLAADDLELQLTTVADCFYIYQGDMQARFSAKKIAMEHSVPREFSFQNSDISDSPKQSILTILSPERMTLLALLRCNKASLKLGKKFKYNLVWKQTEKITISLTYEDDVRKQGVQFHVLRGNAMCVSTRKLHPSIRVIIEAYYNAESGLFERVVLSHKGKMDTIPLWFPERPKTPASQYKYEMSVDLQLSIRNVAHGMPMSYSDDAVEAAVRHILEKGVEKEVDSVSTVMLALEFTALHYSGLPDSHPRVRKITNRILSEKRSGDRSDTLYPKGNTYGPAMICLWVHAMQTSLEAGVFEANGVQKAKDMLREATSTIELVLAGTKESKELDMSRFQMGILGLYAATATGWYEPSSRFLADRVSSMIKLQKKRGKSLSYKSITRVKEEDYGKANEGSSVLRFYSRLENVKQSAAARGWPYVQINDLSSGSMTCGGIGSLTMLQTLLDVYGKREPYPIKKLSFAIADGLGWMHAFYTVQHNPGFRNEEKNNTLPRNEHYGYYMYSLERAATLSHVDFIAGKDWYAEGVRNILRLQSPEGNWLFRDNATFDSENAAFFLLFLRRSSVPLRDSVVLSSPR